MSKHEKAIEKIKAKLFSKRLPQAYGMRPESIRTLEPIEAFTPGEPESLGGVEAAIGTRGVLTISIKHSGDKQFLIHVFLHEPGRPRLTLFYDQCQFQYLDQRVFKMCQAAFALHEPK